MKIRIPAKELVEADITAVSLVKHAANRSPFKILKSEDGVELKVGDRIAKLFGIEKPEPKAVGAAADGPQVVALMLRKEAADDLKPLLTKAGLPTEGQDVDGVLTITFPGQSVAKAEDGPVVMLSRDLGLLFDRPLYDGMPAISSGIRKSLSTVSARLWAGVAKTVDVEAVTKSLRNTNAHVEALLAAMPPALIKLDLEPRITTMRKTTKLSEAAPGDIDDRILKGDDTQLRKEFGGERNPEQKEAAPNKDAGPAGCKACGAKPGEDCGGAVGDTCGMTGEVIKSAAAKEPVIEYGVRKTLVDNKIVEKAYSFTRDGDAEVFISFVDSLADDAVLATPDDRLTKSDRDRKAGLLAKAEADKAKTVEKQAEAAPGVSELLKAIGDLTTVVKSQGEALAALTARVEAAKPAIEKSDAAAGKRPVIKAQNVAGAAYETLATPSSVGGRRSIQKSEDEVSTEDVWMGSPLDNLARH